MNGEVTKKEDFFKGIVNKPGRTGKLSTVYVKVGKREKMEI